MRKLNILKAALDVFWFFSIITLIGVILFLPFYLFRSDMNYPIKIKGHEITNPTIFSKVIVFINVISSLLFLYSIYLLRKVVNLFRKKEIFNNEIVRLFNLIGILIVSSSLIGSFSIFIYNIIERKHLDYFSLDFGTYDSFLISISIGLFFLVISEVFKIAKIIKEENELTV